MRLAVGTRDGIDAGVENLVNGGVFVPRAARARLGSQGGASRET